VGDLAKKTVAEKSLNIDDAEVLEDAAYLIGITHDLGKATSFSRNTSMKRTRGRKGPSRPGM